MQTFKLTKNSIHSWCPNIEAGAMEQMEVIANLPYVTHCALMPDAHQGMAMPIGGVVATNNVIVPNFVGVDIGCGMCAVKTSLKKSDLASEDLRKTIHNAIHRGVPMGFSKNTDSRRKFMEEKYEDEICALFNTINNSLDATRTVDINAPFIFDIKGDNNDRDIRKIVTTQVGTLGGGNHFIEIQYDENDNVWIMLHSGSRNIGKRVCDYFNSVAKIKNEIWYSNNLEIPFLPIDDYVGKDYLAWMTFALGFAFLNRKAMMEEVKRNLVHYFPGCIFDDMINIHHNYASLEHHMGKDVWVHRKGATLARKDTVGIIPGSMGTASYIVRGLGNKLSLESCSHGAGRTMGRKAFNVLNNSPEKLTEIQDQMKGIVYSRFSTVTRGKDAGMKDVSEAPGAYKDIEDVINNEKDLITPIHRLLPLISWKSEDNVD